MNCSMTPMQTCLYFFSDSFDSLSKSKIDHPLILIKKYQVDTINKSIVKNKFYLKDNSNANYIMVELMFQNFYIMVNDITQPVAVA